MNGLAIQPGSGAFTGVPTAWTVSGVGDFNGDGKSDVLWRNANGDVAIWMMNGTTLLPGSGDFINVGATWTISGVGDFNGDGKSDILWRGNDGSVAGWFMNGTAINAAPPPGTFAVVP